MQTSAATGVALKWIGLFDYLRSGRRTGPLVRMVLVIATDMVPFLSILLLAATAATFFFVIDLPGSHNYSSNPIVGIFWPAVTMIRALLGNFDIGHYRGCELRGVREYKTRLVQYKTRLKKNVTTKTTPPRFVNIIGDYNKWSAILCFVVVTFFVMILMLNLLIAIMQDSYDKVKEREDQARDVIPEG